MTTDIQASALADHGALFAVAAGVIPSLKGRLTGVGDRPHLLAAPPHSTPAEVAAALYDHWRLAHPEAGPAYWLTRSWGMLCWQSLYLTMAAVYRLGAVPAVDRMGQDYQDGVVSGFTLPADPMIKGDVSLLIKVAGERLQAHWQALFALLGGVQRLRPGFVRPLLADDLLAALVRVPDFFTHVSREQVSEHAPRWLAACGLPAEHLAGWRPASILADTLSPGYVRQRCCLHYKRRDGELCANCPRRHGATYCQDEP
ncbi:TPA: siderophore ferric iron reductase [Aeromonas salmonicida subsp. smithia]